jgi:hypothetical protein
MKMQSDKNIDKKGMVEKLSIIEEKIGKIDKKLSDKWVLPVLLTILTTILGIANFLVERHYNNTDISLNKQREVIGEFIANSKVEFYKDCIIHLNNINEQFESFCKIDQSKENENQLDSMLIQFRKFIAKQQVIDQKVIEPAKAYAEYISEVTFDISSGQPNMAELNKMYNQSQQLFSESYDSLNKSISELQKQ